ncbi:MAG: hypothetical protein H6772_03585 [Pseudomonadales bacterium]|nr:hypothetical protein [Pseudomonadales bacterium]
MKKIITKLSAMALIVRLSLGLFVFKVLAFTNPVIGESLGGNAEEAADGTTFVNYFVTVWNAFIVIGAILVLIYFLWGAIQWISAGGDKSKIETARNRITHSILGLIILVSSFVIIGFISSLLFGDEFSILNLQFVAPGEAP